MHLLLKPLFHLLEPLTLLLAGMALLTVLLFRRRQRGLAWLGLTLWLLLAVTTCTALGNWALAGIERQWADMPSRWAALPVCDVVVCLGGGVMPDPTEITGIDMTENSDRITTAVELVRRGDASFLMLGGGSAQGEDGASLSESAAVRRWIKSWNLVNVPMDDLGICNNTHDEAVKFSAKAKAHGWTKVMLVTSASHMRRAVAVFRKTTGLEVVPVACAFQTGVAIHGDPREWLHYPEAGELNCLSTWIYETIGWWTYKAQGWVD